MSNTYQINTKLARQREAAWNTEFLLADGTAFAGLYIAPNTDISSVAPELTFEMMLDHLQANFDFTMAREETENRFDSKWVWGFMPVDATMGQPDMRQEFSYPGAYYGVTEDWSMDVHFKTGRYYVVRHEKCCMIQDMDCYGTFENPEAHRASEYLPEVYILVNHLTIIQHPSSVFKQIANRIAPQQTTALSMSSMPSQSWPATSVPSRLSPPSAPPYPSPPTKSPTPGAISARTSTVRLLRA